MDAKICDMLNLTFIEVEFGITVTTATMMMMKVFLEKGGGGGSGKRIWGSSPLRFINTTRGPPATTPKLDDDDHT